MVNTKQTFHSEKKAISPNQSTDRGGRAPLTQPKENMKNRYKYKLMDYFIMDEKSLSQRKKFVKDCEEFFKKESERASKQASRERAS